MKEYRFIGSHPETLDGGRPIEPGEFTGPIDVALPQNEHLLDAGVLLDVPDGTFQEINKTEAPEAPHQLKGDELKARADELDIPNRTKMSADELREALRRAEVNPTSEEGQQS